MPSICRGQFVSIVGMLFILLGITDAFRPLRRMYAPEEPCNRQKIVCYISAANWQFDYETIQPKWCTHYVLIDLIVLNSEGKLLIIEQAYPALTLLTEFKLRLQQMGDSAKFILAIGGVNQDSAHFSHAVSDAGGVRRVAESIAIYAVKYCFDGVDIAWFYPGKFGGCELDRENLVELLRELRCFLREGNSLSVTVGVDPRNIDLTYNVSGINMYVDFVNLLSGDFHDQEQASHVSALYPGDSNDIYNIYSSVKAYVKAGVPGDKLIVLTSTYGYLYSLKHCHQPAMGTVKSIQKLNNLCIREILAQENFFTTWDDVRKVPYSTLIRGDTMKWITFNDLESHRYKAEFVRKYKLGGIGAFTIDQDAGECNDNMPFPFLWTLVKTIRPELEFRERPRIICNEMTNQCPMDTFDEVKEICTSESIPVKDECHTVKYKPLRTKIEDCGDVRYQAPPPGVTWMPLVMTNPPRTTPTTSRT